MFQSMNVWVIVGAMLTWLIFILGVAQLARFYTRFQECSRNMMNELQSLNAQLQKIQSSMAELIIEQRRQIRLQNEQLELKRAEMTGDYEIVEEPLNPSAPLPSPNAPKIDFSGKK